MAALGAAAGLCYDLLGRLRRGRLTAGAADLFLGALCAAGMTGIALRLRMNPFRLYAFAGVALGLAAYAATLGRLLRFFAARSARLRANPRECVKKLNNVAEMMNLLQEKMKKGRIMTVQICQKMRGMGDVAAKRKRIRPFRILAVLMGAGTLAMLMRFPAKAVSLERQQEQLVAAAQAYHDAQSENNQLKTALTEIDSSDFIERTARRDYGYCWYGEIIYQVGNLDEIEQQLDFDVYGQD